MKAIVVAGLLAAGVALTAVVTAGSIHHSRMHGHEHGSPGMEWLVDGALDDLEATDAQRTKVLAVKDRLAGQMRALHEEHEVVHAAFLREWGKDAMDKPALHALLDAKMDGLRTSLHGVVDGVAEIHDTLTPEQRRRLVERVQEMHGSR